MLQGILNSLYAFKRQQDEAPTTFSPCIQSSDIEYTEQVSRGDWTVVWRSAEKTSVGVTKICIVLRNFCWQYRLCGLKKKQIIDFYTILHSSFVLKNGSLKVKKKKNVLRFVLCNWIILSGGACPFIIEHNSRKWGITKQLLSGFSGNRWSVALKPSQQLYTINISIKNRALSLNIEIVTFQFTIYSTISLSPLLCHMFLCFIKMSITIKQHPQIVKLINNSIIKLFFVLSDIPAVSKNHYFSLINIQCKFPFLVIFKLFKKIIYKESTMCL